MPPKAEHVGAKRVDRITAINREAWDICFPGELENYDYLLAVERAHMKGFDHAYYVVMDGTTLLAAIPGFFTDYNLVTTAEGAVRNALLVVQRIVPKLLTLKLACLGSAATETCPIGFHPSCSESKQRELLAQLLACFDSDTQAQRINLLAFKDVNAANKKHFGDIIGASGFHGVTGMPSAISRINFSSIEEYLASLSSATRKDMRRKLKRRSEVRVEYRTQIDDIVDTIYAMYMETKSRSDLQFEELTPDYFLEVMRCMGERSICSVYYAGDTIIGANLMLMNKERLLDKFFCMYTQSGHDYNLYFLSWFSNLQFCLDKGLSLYQSGQAGYETKLRLGSELLENWMYFRHRNWLADKLLSLASPLLAFDVPDAKN
jgi:predicted N-acyltransferase